MPAQKGLVTQSTDTGRLLGSGGSLASCHAYTSFHERSMKFKGCNVVFKDLRGGDRGYIVLKMLACPLGVVIHSPGAIAKKNVHATWSNPRTANLKPLKPCT